MNGWTAFRSGLARASRYSWVLAILYAVNLTSALLLAALPALGLAAWLGRLPAIRHAADGVDAWMVIEMLIGWLGQVNSQMVGPAGSMASSGLALQALATLGMLAVIPLAAWLPSTFLTGGVLLTYVEAPQPFRWRRFLWGGWRWFGPFLLLSVLQGAAATAMAVLAAVATVAAAALVGAWVFWLAVPLLALLAAAWLALIELTRAQAVAQGTRNVFRAWGQAARLVFRRPLPVVSLYALALLLLGAVHALFRWGLLARLPLNWWLLVFPVQQAFVLARLWARLARWAGSVVISQNAQAKPLDFASQS